MLFDRFPPAFTGTVGATDNIGASFEATSHLFQCGHLRIAIIAGTQGISAVDEHVEGFRRGMFEAGDERDRQFKLPALARFPEGSGLPGHTIEPHLTTFVNCFQGFTAAVCGTLP